MGPKLVKIAAVNASIECICEHTFQFENLRRIDDSTQLAISRQKRSGCRLISGYADLAGRFVSDIPEARFGKPHHPSQPIQSIPKWQAKAFVRLFRSDRITRIME